MLTNKKAISEVAASSMANESIGRDSMTLSDKIRTLYRYLRLNNHGKFYVKTAVDAAYRFN